MSVSNDSTLLNRTIAGRRAFLSSTFLEFCDKVRNNDPSILPEFGEGKPFKIRSLSEGESIELSDALLENTSVRYLEVGTEEHTKSSAEAMAKYVRTSKHLQRVRWGHGWITNDRELRHREEILCYFLPAIQESTSLKELDIELPCGRGPSYLAFENMLTHTQSLRSLSIISPVGLLEDWAAVLSGLKKNTTLRELTLDIREGATTISPILTSLRDHPSLRRLCLCGDVVDLTGLESVLLSDDSKITELEIHGIYDEDPPLGLAQVLQALGRQSALTELILTDLLRLGRDEARLLRMILCNNPSLQRLDLNCNHLGSAGLAELAPALYSNTSITVLDITMNRLQLDDMESARLLRNILRHNKTMTTLYLCGNAFGLTAGAVECIADGLAGNSTLLEIDLSSCHLRDDDVSILAQTLGSRNTTLQKVALNHNSITSTSLGVFLETMEQNNHHITNLDLEHNPIGNEGARLLARLLGNNALPSLKRLSISDCHIGDDGFMALVSALERNNSLLQLNLNLGLRFHEGVSERAFLALAESLPEIKVLQRVEFDWCTSLASAMPSLLAGLRENTSVFRFDVAGCAPRLFPPSPEETARYAGGWMQEMELLGYRNCFLPLIRAPKERLPPRGIWPHALARAATLPDVLFEVLRSKPNLVPCEEDAEGKEVAEDTGIPKKRKRGDE
jgi:hypothetical protein